LKPLGLGLEFAKCWVLFRLWAALAFFETSDAAAEKLLLPARELRWCNILATADLGGAHALGFEHEFGDLLRRATLAFLVVGCKAFFCSDF
jgi:hypothetical protein